MERSDAQVEQTSPKDLAGPRCGARFDHRVLTLAAIFTTMILVLSHIPKDAMPQCLQSGRLDKAAHFLAYAAMTLILFLSVRAPIGALSATLIVVGIVTLGVVDEVTQPLVNRIADPIDLAADVVGVAAVLIFFALFRLRHTRIFSKRICSPPGNGVESRHTER